MTDHDTHDTLKNVMAAIRSGKVRQRARWQFILPSVLAGLAALILLGTLLYIASFAFFALRISGAFLVSFFGVRGFFSFLHALPLLLIALLIVFVVVLEILVRRYSFIYRRPLLLSAGVIFLIVLLGGAALARLPFHVFIYREARAHQLPAPLVPVGEIYKAGMPNPDGVHRGVVLIEKSGNGFYMRTDQGGTTTVIIGPDTRLPFGGKFTVGEQVIVFGDDSSGTIKAIGAGVAPQ